MEWKTDTRKYASGEQLYLGPWVVGGAHYDGTVPQGRRERFRATSLLPGISSGLGLHESMAAAKERVEQATNAWLANLPPNAISAAIAATK